MTRSQAPDAANAIARGAPGGLVGKGHPDAVLGRRELRAIIAAGLARWGLDGKRVLCLVPDSTRTAPMPFIYRAVRECLDGVVASLDWLVALGTHPPMTQDGLAQHLGLAGDDLAALAHVRNHAWEDPASLVSVGQLSADEVRALSGGLLQDAIPVRVNRLVLDCDVAIVVGPVFPHEVIGFSGGNKYFFPGISGRELIDASHWLGALIGTSEIMGVRGTTPVRALIDRAAAMLPVERRCIAMVVRPSDAALHGLYLGDCHDAWQAAVDLSAAVHVEVVDRAYETVIAVAPTMYADLWTAGKCAYKLEPIVADGGELVVYAPHVDSFSVIHAKAIAFAGYHCRDYFLAHAERYAEVPRGVLAHGTHVRGRGSYDPATGTERGRITVTLASQIPRETCERAGLAWRDHRTIDLDASEAREDILVVRRAGEVLHRVASGLEIRTTRSI